MIIRITITKLRIVAVLLGVAFLSSGCVPMVAHYFEPSGPGINVTRGLCNGRVGFPEVASVVRGNQKLTIEASREPHWILSRRSISGKSIFIEMSFSLRPGQSISFDPTTIKANDTHGNNLPLLRNPQVVIWKGSYPPYPLPSDITNRYSYSNSEVQQYGAVTLYLEFGANDLKEFYLNSSPVIFSGTEYIPPPVFFREVFDATIFPLNC